MKIDEIVENFLKYLKDIKSQDEFEGRFEEYVLYHLDINVLLSLKQNLDSQRKKNSYDLLEIEYKEKSILLDYFIEIGSEIIKTFRDNNFKSDQFVICRSIWNDISIYDSLYKVTKDSQRKYKERFLIIKEKRIFDVSEYKINRNCFIVWQFNIRRGQ